MPALTLTRLLPLKIAGSVAYFASLPLYLFIEQSVRNRAVIMPFTAIDRFIPVMPWLVAVYLGQLLVVGIPFLLIDDLGRWLRAVFGLTAIALVAFAIYLMFPVALERFPSVESGLGFMRPFDTRANALPSLHAACAIYSAMLLHGNAAIPRRMLIIGWVWTAIVLISCVSLRQHTLLDIITGSILGAAFAFILRVHRITP